MFVGKEEWSLGGTKSHDAEYSGSLITLLQESLVEGGYAKVAYLYNDYKYTNILLEKQELVSSKNIGIWDQEAKVEYESNINKDDKEEESNIYIFILTMIFLIIVGISKLIKKK